MVSSHGRDELAGRLHARLPSASVRAISASRRWTRRRLVLGQRLDRADPHHLHRVARELNQPDDRVDVGPVLQKRDHRDALLGLGTVDQASQADLFLGQASGFQDQARHLTNDRVLVVQPLEEHFIGQKRASLRERGERLLPDVGDRESST